MLFILFETAGVPLDPDVMAPITRSYNFIEDNVLSTVPEADLDLLQLQLPELKLAVFGQPPITFGPLDVMDTELDIYGGLAPKLMKALDGSPDIHSEESVWQALDEPFSGTSSINLKDYGVRLSQEAVDTEKARTPLQQDLRVVQQTQRGLLAKQKQKPLKKENAGKLAKATREIEKCNKALYHQPSQPITTYDIGGPFEQ
jgi:hypothetical protein